MLLTHLWVLLVDTVHFFYIACYGCFETLQVMGVTMKPVYRRRPRVDPSKLAVDQLTGDENVTVVNRNTGKRITGAKAPALRNLQDWLIRNPGFDVDAKWAHIVHKAVSIHSGHFSL